MASDPKPLTIAHNAVTAVLKDATAQDLAVISQMLSYMVEGAEHMKGFGKGWDGRSSFFDFATRTFPAGFVMSLRAALIQQGRKVQVVHKPFPAPLGPENPVVDNFPFDPRYKYQPETIERLLKHGQIIAQVATGGGKSKIAKLAFARIKRRTLFLTTRGILMHQMRGTFMTDLGVPVGIFGDGSWSRSPELLNVGMVQSFIARLEVKTVDSEWKALTSRRVNAENKEVEVIRQRFLKEGKTQEEFAIAYAVLIDRIRAGYENDKDIKSALAIKVTRHEKKRLETVELLKTFELVILEEAHEVSSDSFFLIMNQCTNAYYRLALTATPFMKDSEEANMRLQAVAGPVGIKVSEKQLIDCGILARPFFKYITVPDVQNLYKTTPFQTAYNLGIVNNPIRTQMIVRELQDAKRYGLSAMVLVLHKEHGKSLQEVFTTQGIKCIFIDGDSSQDDRQAAILALKERRIDVLIGSIILDVGVDVPAVGMIIKAGGGKAEVADRQRTGRGLREKKDGGPNCAFIVDFMDQQNNHLRAHSRERMSIVTSTPGFAEGMVHGAFPYEDLGFIRKAA